MKKTYIVPCSIAMNFVTEGMMAQSLRVSGDETMTSGDFLSNKRQNGPWNNETSSNPSGPWTNMNE
ncbi:MAG: hypothetical protein PUI06_07890 [Prevotella sp.]|nr:hypothetical protein [Prevotella sp.]MDY5665753.1 hypothetical protein [Alloprevotella sp.]